MDTLADYRIFYRAKGLWYNRNIEKIDVTGLLPEVKVYISSLESNVSTLTLLPKYIQKGGCH